MTNLSDMAVQTERATSPTAATRSTSRMRAGIGLMAVCILATALVSRGIRDESAVSLEGDMPHYLMNGVFFYDLILDAPFRAPLQYAQRYYARYPALTLGHHPFATALAETPFFFLFGISVFGARLSTLCALLLAVGFLFRLVHEIYDTPTAVFASLLFISTPGVVPIFQVVLSEPLTLALILASLYFMHRLCVTDRVVYSALFGVTVVLSAYAKHLAVFMFPVYAFQYVSAFGVRRLLARSTLVMVVVIGVCLLPLIPLTLKYSQWNVTIVTQFVRPGRRTSGTNFLRFAQGMWRGSLSLSLPLLWLAAAAVIGAILRRDRRILLALAWVGSVYVGLLVVGVRNDRFFCYWLPAFAVLAAAVFQLGSKPAWRATWTVLLAATVGYQLWLGSQEATQRTMFALRPAGAEGYEEAAQYVVGNRRGETVLYSASVDTGYFVFFTRKHDVDRTMVIIRADKILTTSRMRIADFERHIGQRDEILPILKRYGVGYVVIEDRPYPDGPLRWLQEIVQTDDFELRRRIPVRSSDPRLDGATLSVYAYRGLTPADPAASLSINVPLMGERIEVRLKDLTGARTAPIDREPPQIR